MASAFDHEESEKTPRLRIQSLQTRTLSLQPPTLSRAANINSAALFCRAAVRMKINVRTKEQREPITVGVVAIYVPQDREGSRDDYYEALRKSSEQSTT